MIIESVLEFILFHSFFLNFFLQNFSIDFISLQNVRQVILIFFYIEYINV